MARARATLFERMQRRLIAGDGIKEKEAAVPHEFRVKQGGMVVAQVESGHRWRAVREAAHYAMIYGQDGPVAVEEKIKGRWRKAK